MPSDWIEQNLKPQLADVASRDWTKDSLADFMMGLHNQIKAATESGTLPPEEADEAHDLVRGAVRSIPGVSVAQQTATTAAGGTTRAVRRPQTGVE
jgi:hypothetical protein